MTPACSSAPGPWLPAGMTPSLAFRTSRGPCLRQCGYRRSQLVLGGTILREVRVGTVQRGCGALAPGGRWTLGSFRALGMVSHPLAAFQSRVHYVAAALSGLQRYFFWIA